MCPTFHPFYTTQNIPGFSPPFCSEPEPRFLYLKIPLAQSARQREFAGAGISRRLCPRVLGIEKNSEKKRLPMHFQSPTHCFFPHTKSRECCNVVHPTPSTSVRMHCAQAVTSPGYRSCVCRPGPGLPPTASRELSTLVTENSRPGRGLLDYIHLSPTQYSTTVLRAKVAHRGAF